MVSRVIHDGRLLENEAKVYKGFCINASPISVKSLIPFHPDKGGLLENEAKAYKVLFT